MSTLTALFLLGAILSIMSPVFLTPKNLLTVMLQASVNSILSLGMTFIIITGNIDLSIGSVVALSATAIGFYMHNFGLNPYLGIVLIFFIGLATGFVSGTIITQVGIPAFIVTLGSMQIWRGLALQLSKGTTAFGFAPVIKFFGQGKIGIVPVPVVIVFMMYFLGWFILTKTKLGLNTYAIGGNEGAARLSGINVKKIKVILFTMNGFLCSLAALILMGRMDSSTGIMADGYEMDAVSATIIGGASLFGGEGNVWGTLIGALLIGVLRNGLNLMNVSAYLQKVAIGLVIVLAVSIDGIRRKSTNA
jgi:ribose transport system permease protein